MQTNVGMKYGGVKGGALGVAVFVLALFALLVSAPQAWAATQLQQSWFDGKLWSDPSYTGQEIRPFDEGVYDENYNVLTPGTHFTISYENNVQAGTATYTATGIGSYEGTVSGTFTIAPTSLDPNNFVVDMSLVGGNKFLKTGSVITPTPQFKMWDGGKILPASDYKVSYTDASGAEVEPVDAGTYTVTCTPVTGNVTDSASMTFSILDEPLSIADATLNGVDESVSYNGGNPVTLPYLSVSMNGELLTEGVDYSVSYENNCLVGTAKVIVTGMGVYAGSTSAEFQVAKCDISKVVTYDSLGGVSNLMSHPYTGSAITPSVHATSEGYTLQEGVDYVVSYRNNVDPWLPDNLLVKEGDVAGDPAVRPTVVVTGIGGYEGEALLGFTITPDTVDLSGAVLRGFASRSFTGQPQPLSMADCTYAYINTYGSYATFDLRGVLTTTTYLNAAGEEVSADQVVDAGSYTMVVTAQGGDGFTGTKSVDFSIAQLSFDETTVSVSVPDQVAGVSEVHPVVTATVNGEPYTLVEGVDYTVSDLKVYEAGGSLKVVSTGKNFAAGSIVKTFVVASQEQVEASKALQGDIAAAEELAAGELQPMGASLLTKAISEANSALEDENRDAESLVAADKRLKAAERVATALTGTAKSTWYTTGTYEGLSSQSVSMANGFSTGELGLSEVDADGKVMAVVAFNDKGASLMKGLSVGNSAADEVAAGYWAVMVDESALHAVTPVAFTYQAGPTMRTDSADMVVQFTSSAPIAFVKTSDGTASMAGKFIEAEATITEAAGSYAIDITPTDEGNGYIAGITYGADHVAAENVAAEGASVNTFRVISSSIDGLIPVTFSITMMPNPTDAYLVVNPGDLSKAVVSVADQTATGEALTPDATVTLDGKQLVAGTDYVIEFADTEKAGTATATVTGINRYVGSSATTTFNVVDPAPEVATVAMNRLYNPNGGEHFYTASDEERDGLVKLGWQYEGTGWVAPETSDTPVYRLYNPNGGDHHYTMSAEERDWLVSLGWNYEGIGWYSDDAQTVKLYREYNPNAQSGSHNYTTSLQEHKNLVKLGWHDEGTAWYGVAAG
ncbi:hypothetical protein [Denitrobacterium detoxificans]|uniref:DUF5648 domain-containing protein n=1 Tax=Denitrobacterium detoxificans TaxID=79604 RepID=A0A1H8QNW3_9ACTN|nr:hypothetical protein [Denitrobacterium detoxificans]SEO55909.1 hypothetical protein SAMN02910314_00559 [Denitrobacterium detoxificans]